MNVYVRQLAAALGNMGMQIDIFTREHSDVVNRIETIGPNVRVIHIAAGDTEAHVGELYALLPAFLKQLNAFREEEGLKYDVVHSHYWLSSWVGRELSQAMGVPHLVTFHTLGLIKMQSRAGEVEQPERPLVEAEVMADFVGVGRSVDIEIAVFDQHRAEFGADIPAVVLCQGRRCKGRRGHRHSYDEFPHYSFPFLRIGATEWNISIFQAPRWQVNNRWEL